MTLLSDLVNQGSSSLQLLATLAGMLGRGAPATGGTVSTGNVLMPGDPSLASLKGVTLQGPALTSLEQIARQSSILPGMRELRFITDSYRTPAQQASAYARKPGLAAPPGHSLHQQGLAIDASWWSAHPELVRMLEAAGWSRFSPTGEPWHWSYGRTG